MKKKYSSGFLILAFVIIGLNSNVYAQANFEDLVADVEITLPVNIVNFSAKNGVGNSVVLQWQTGFELNNKGFELEYSKNNIEFSSIQWIPSKHKDGNATSVTNYSYTDLNAKVGNNFYRLNQIDKDGKATLSKVVLIKLSYKDGLELINIYPNPTVSE